MRVALKNRLRNCAYIVEHRKSCLVCPDRRICEGLPGLLKRAADDIEAHEPVDDAERERLHNEINYWRSKIEKISNVIEQYGGANEN